ncbi:DsbA family oxidoreductase [Chitinolyticbacter meiyuanensis]|uniref:DsbA family oxidoreductase n=1 Tax=Chitinolyticbacter meiyuanensis TaxID=682798 RepID=UPI0011E5D884|nr:DsbA family oxidoreductase [Chitinolyticbacter meiyuanensis]
MAATLKIDFVSDVVCPWCAIGLQGLLQGAAQAGVELDLTFHPFELNPQMGPEGEDIAEHLIAKYGMSREQLAQSQEAIRQRGEALGFHFDMDARSRTYNTFDAHRLLHWAGELGAAQQLALKQALLQAYFGAGRNVSAADVLVEAAIAAGLDGEAAREVLESPRYAGEVRETERHYQQQGISGVPAVIINQQYLISGGQPPETFAQALRRIADGQA